MTEAQAEEDLFKLDPNVALSMGLAQGRFLVADKQKATEDDEQISSLIQEE